MNAEISDVEELIPADVPLVLIFRTEEGPWIAGAIDWVEDGLQYVATRVTEAELLMVREHRFSLYGASADRPWREVIADARGYRFGAHSGDRLDDARLPAKGTALDIFLPAIPDIMPELSEVEVLYDYDGPMIVLLSDGRDLWLANCDKADDGVFRYAASRITAEEADAIRAERISLRAAYTDRPWFGIGNDGSGYRFDERHGTDYPPMRPPLAGVGLASKRDLPDRLSGIGPVAPET